MTGTGARRAAERLARMLGATVTVETIGTVYAILIDAPRGQHWIDGTVHALRVDARPTCNADRAELWQTAIDRMRAGLAACTAECEELTADD